MPDCQSNLPLLRSKHMSVRRFSALMDCVTKTRSPHTAGEEFPGPGSGTCHRTFCSGLQVCGSCFSFATPVPSGPRQPGKLPANAAAPMQKLRPMKAPCFIKCDLRFICSHGLSAFWLSVLPSIHAATRSKIRQQEYPVSDGGRRADIPVRSNVDSRQIGSEFVA